MTTKTRPAKAPHLSPAVVELHALIESVLRELAAHVAVSVDLVDSRQAPTVGFLTPDGRKARDKAIVAERTARLVSAKAGVEIPGETAAPLNIAAVSIAAETRSYLLEVVAELHDDLRRAGICWVGETWWREGFYDRTSITDVSTYLIRLVELVRRPARLQPIHRHLEDLANRAKRVVDGEDRHTLPEPCPHCRRHSLVVYTSRFVARCEHDPATGRLEACTCDDPACPCRSTHTDYRHEWHRVGEHKHNSWHGLERAQRHAREHEENELTAQAAIERIHALHTPTWIDDDGTEQLHLTWTTIAPADHECRPEDDPHGACDPIDDSEISMHAVPACIECVQLTEAGAEYVAYPCPTIRALDDPAEDDTDEGAPR